MRKQQSVIALLLANILSDAIDETTFGCYSTRAGVKKALADYRFWENERAWLSFEGEHNFRFAGSGILFIYMIYNLINNAFYLIAKSARGEIYISLCSGEEYNSLIFKKPGQVSQKPYDRIFLCTFIPPYPKTQVMAWTCRFVSE